MEANQPILPTFSENKITKVGIILELMQSNLNDVLESGVKLTLFQKKFIL